MLSLSGSSPTVAPFVVLSGARGTGSRMSSGAVPVTACLPTRSRDGYERRGLPPGQVWLSAYADRHHQPDRAVDEISLARDRPHPDRLKVHRQPIQLVVEQDALDLPRPDELQHDSLRAH